MNIAIVHPTPLNGKGGAETLCLRMVDALQNDYNISLILPQDPDFDDLENFYGINIGRDNIEMKIVESPDILGKIKTLNLDVFRRVYFNRSVSSRVSDYDVVIYTKNEQSIDHENVINYIHFPYISPLKIIIYNDIPKSERSPNIKDIVLDTLEYHLSNLGKSPTRNNHFIANSKWTARIVSRVHDSSCDVIYPPVDVSEFRELKWSEREDGFISIGSIHPKKNIIRNIKIVKSLQYKGYDIHYHIIGNPGKEAYFRNIKERIRDDPMIDIETSVSRDRLLTLLQNHKYGIHGHNSEHYGIAVAEMVCSGLIPFVPNDGGQQEVVGNDQRVIYSGINDCVNKIANVHRDPNLSQDIQKSLENNIKELSCSGFKKNLVEIIESEYEVRN